MRLRRTYPRYPAILVLGVFLASSSLSIPSHPAQAAPPEDRGHGRPEGVGRPDGADRGQQSHANPSKSGDAKRQDLRQ